MERPGGEYLSYLVLDKTDNRKQWTKYLLSHDYRVISHMGHPTNKVGATSLYQIEKLVIAEKHLYSSTITFTQSEFLQLSFVSLAPINNVTLPSSKSLNKQSKWLKYTIRDKSFDSNVFETYNLLSIQLTF